jgi:hypothetical protein
MFKGRAVVVLRYCANLAQDLRWQQFLNEGLVDAGFGLPEVPLPLPRRHPLIRRNGMKGIPAQIADHADTDRVGRGIPANRAASANWLERAAPALRAGH